MGWDDGVAERAETVGTVHEGGKPISASTNDGLRTAFPDPSLPAVSVRRTWRPSGGECSGDCEGSSLFQSRAAGFAHRCACGSSASPVAVALAPGCPCVPTRGVFRSAASRLRFAPCVDLRSAPGRRPSCAFGVGQKIPVVLSPIRPWYGLGPCRRSARSSCSQYFELLRLTPFAFSQASIASVSVVPECRPLSVEYPAAPELFASVLVAVGQDEEPLASVRRSDIGRAQHTPLRIEPERGKVGKDVGEPKRNVPGDVLEEPKRGAGFVEDSCDVRPQVSLVGVAESSSGDAEWLARVAACDEIHRATPRSSVEGSKVRPDRRAIQGLVFHPGHEDGRGESVPLDITHGATPGGQAEVDASDTGAQAEGT